MVKAKQGPPDEVTVPDARTRLLRAQLILEECLETINALGVSVYDDIRDDDPEFNEMLTVGMENLVLKVTHEPDLVEIADGCADISVVTIGTLMACGIPDKELLELVDNNNLAKFGPGHSYGPTGKLIKPPDHQPPDIAGLLEQIKSHQLKNKETHNADVV